MFFLRHVLPIIVLLGIIGFAIVTILQRPAADPVIASSKNPLAKTTTVKTGDGGTDIKKIPVTSSKPLRQQPAKQPAAPTINAPTVAATPAPKDVPIIVTKPDISAAPEIQLENKPETSPVTQLKQAETHQITVGPGDSLTQIALREYGRPEYYHAIYTANQNALANPHSLTPGQILNIPPKKDAKITYEKYKASLLAR